MLFGFCIVYKESFVILVIIMDVVMIEEMNCLWVLLGMKFLFVLGVENDVNLEEEEDVDIFESC